MDEFSAEDGFVGKAAGVGRIGEHDEDEVDHLFRHGHCLRGLESGMVRRGRGGEPVEELEPVENGDEDEGGIEDDHGALEEDDVLIVGVLAEAVLLVMQLLSTHGEAIANPEADADLSDKDNDCGRRKKVSVLESRLQLSLSHLTS